MEQLPPSGWHISSVLHEGSVRAAHTPWHQLAQRWGREHIHAAPGATPKGSKAYFFFERRFLILALQVSNSPFTCQPHGLSFSGHAAPFLPVPTAHSHSAVQGSSPTACTAAPLAVVHEKTFNGLRLHSWIYSDRGKGNTNCNFKF